MVVVIQHYFFLALQTEENLSLLNIKHARQNIKIIMCMENNPIYTNTDCKYSMNNNYFFLAIQ